MTDLETAAVCVETLIPSLLVDVENNRQRGGGREGGRGKRHNTNTKKHKKCGSNKLLLPRYPIKPVEDSPAVLIRKKWKDSHQVF